MHARIHLLAQALLAQILLATLLSFNMSPAVAADAGELLLIIDDLGNNRALGERTVALPGPLHLAILPHTPHAKVLARKGFARQHEIMLHAPMANQSGARLGPGALTGDMAAAQLRQTLAKNLNAIPHVRGMNNHMGSLLTQNRDAMAALMPELNQRGLYFIDSLTTPQSLAWRIAKAHQLPVLKRHVFLDNSTKTADLARQFNQALAIAKRQGLAILIGHPYPQTLDFLEQKLPTLAQQQIRLVSASEIFQRRLAKRFQQLQQADADKASASRYQLDLDAFPTSFPTAQAELAQH